MAQNIKATESTGVRSSGLKFATILAVLVSALWFMRPRQPESPIAPTGNAAALSPHGIHGT
ncbi:MAG UNVERIFIED_CONTAM: hypothetical protein LVR18_52025 [Planctomycetaceae bacterium]